MKNPDDKNPLTAAITICCREKDAAGGVMPAIERYRSKRIEAVRDAAAKAGLPFYILSGRFGLLLPEDPIPYYDYLLPPEEAAGLSVGIRKRLRQDEIGRVILFIPDPELDPKSIPYREAVRMATEGAAELEVRHVPPFPETL